MEGHEHEIDAVGVVRRIRDELYEETKNLSTQELIAFYHRHGPGEAGRRNSCHDVIEISKYRET